jgi:large subunit ribosomal protein L22
MAKTTVKKTIEKKAVEGQEVKAVCRSIRTSQRKLNLVAELIRGKGVARAINELTFSKRRIAKVVLETLQSAIANAENNHGLNIDRLVVKEAYTGKDLVMKRMHARGRGRGARVLKPFSNLTVIVATSGEEQ